MFVELAKTYDHPHTHHTLQLGTIQGPTQPRLFTCPVHSSVFTLVCSWVETVPHFRLFFPVFSENYHRIIFLLNSESKNDKKGLKLRVENMVCWTESTQSQSSEFVVVFFGCNSATLTISFQDLTVNCCINYQFLFFLRTGKGQIPTLPSCRSYKQRPNKHGQSINQSTERQPYSFLSSTQSSPLSSVHVFQSINLQFYNFFKKNFMNVENKTTQLEVVYSF